MRKKKPKNLKGEFRPILKIIENSIKNLLLSEIKKKQTNKQKFPYNIKLFFYCM